MSHRRARLWAGLVAVFSIHSQGQSARAADITTVQIDDAGPSRAIPIGSDFYLSGPVSPTTTEVNAVVVRAGTNWLLGRTGPSCRDVAQRLNNSFLGEHGHFPKVSVVSPHANDVWKTTNQDDAELPVYVAATWSRKGHADSDPFKILIPNDRFFSASGKYCLFVYKTEAMKHTDAESAQRIIAQWTGELHACFRGGGNAQRCVDVAQAAREKRIAELATKLDAESAKSLKNAVLKLADPAEAIANASVNLMGILRAIDAAGPGGPTPITRPFEPTQPVALTTPFGRAVLDLLVHNGALVVNPGGEITTPDGGMTVETIRIADDRKTILVQGKQKKPKKGTAPAPFATHTDDLAIGDDDTTLRDVLELLRGKVRMDQGYVGALDLLVQLRPTESALETDLSPQVQAQLVTLDVRAHKLARAIERVLAVAASVPGCERGPSCIGTETNRDSDLAKWLRPLLVPCSPAQLAAWGLPTVSCALADAPANWPMYAQPHTNPLELIHAAASTFGEQSPIWSAAKASLAVTITDVTTTYQTPAASIEATVTQDQWVFSYVTPVIGEVFFMSPAQVFAEPYLAVQIHAVANPVDQPLWTQDGDWKRMFALELGMATARKNLGPDSRFSGWKGLPPLVLGLAIHPLPYTSFSFGSALLDRRATTVTQEQPSAFWSWYVAANVQINIPDLIVALKGRTSTTASHN